MKLIETIGIQEINYYKCHYENFLIRIVTLLDLCCKLGSVVFNIHSKEKDITFYKFSITKEASVSDAVRILKELNAKLSEKKDERNIIIHQENYQSKEIKSIEDTIFNVDLIKIDEVLQQWFNNQKEEKKRRSKNLYSRNNKSND
ncbi:Cthe_2314 family HEPN domain-containing protein [Flavobacterium flavigenum]|uniref:Cthe_2314 family HEPN domain-containing protein n=1 Tax=Flavobacterium flavigenum TaxID=3003258 RepID=UPI0024821625|nr:Cthe_2314 family HEPN domain-containing protein [Flavobacterium flavigenum]